MAYRDDDPDWYRHMYHDVCRRRFEFCVCDLTFAEKAKLVHLSHEKLKRDREGIGRHKR